MRELLVRKTAGNVVELSSFLAVGWSPVWLLAGASDLVGGTKVYLRTLVAELQDSGVLAPEADVASFEELLTALEDTSGVLADTVDVPPLNITSVRTSWQELQRQAADLPDAATLEKIYSELQLAARQEDRSVLEISSMVALGAVRTGVRLGNVHIFEYYRDALRTIVEEGLLFFCGEPAPLPNAGWFPFRSSVEHLFRTPATALGRPAIVCWAPNDAAGRSIGRGKCRPWMSRGTPSTT